MAVTRKSRLSAILSVSAAAIVVAVVACPGRKGSKGDTLVSIAVTPSDLTIPLGTTQQFTATGTYKNGTTTDLTAFAAWESSDVAAADVSVELGSEGLVTTLGMGRATITATYSGKSGSTLLTIARPDLVTIEVTPTNPQVALGTNGQFTATGTYTDGSTQDLTDQVLWNSSAPDKSTISNDAGSHGLAESLAVGETTITASLAGRIGSTRLTVSSAVLVSVEVTPTNPSIPLGTSQQFVATGTFTDGTTQNLTAEVTWNSSVATAQVSNDPGTAGLADSVAIGSSTISATYTGITGSSLLTISSAALSSLDVAPSLPVIALGTTVEFTATGTYTDGSVQDLTARVSWSSSDTAVSTVGDAAGTKGFANSAATGTTTISAQLSGFRASTTLTVSDAAITAIEVTPTNPSAALGTDETFVATGLYTDGSTQDVTNAVTWSSSDTAVATVSNAGGSRGLATTVAVGTTTITATLGGRSGATSFTVSSATLVAIAVSPDAADLALGTTQALSAQGLLSDGTRQDLTTQVTWSSSATGVATVSNADGNRGLVSSVSVGTVTISAAFSGVTGSAAINVTSATLVWIDVTPFVPAIAKGTQQQFQAHGNYTDGSTQDLTTQVTWSTSDGAIASVSNAVGSQGLATGVDVGTAMITATFSSVVETVELGVTAATLDSIAVTPPHPTVPVGVGGRFKVTGTFSDLSTQDMTQLATWSSSDTAVATISNAAGSKGSIQTHSPGTSVITALYAGNSATATLTVTAARLVSIAISPVDPSVPAGYSITVQAVGTYTDATSRTMNDEVFWSSSDPTVATISNSTGTEGRVRGLIAGTTTLSATHPSGVPTTLLTVTNETLESIDVTPASVTVAIGESMQMTATGTFSGGSVLDITSQVQWRATPASRAYVDNLTNKGAITGKKAGGATIRVSGGGQTATASLTVSGS